MSDDTRTTEDGTTQDDTSGHVLHGDAAQNPATGGGHAPSLRSFGVDGPEDDTEGHRVVARADDEPEDDTEGHRRFLV